MVSIGPNVLRDRYINLIPNILRVEVAGFFSLSWAIKLDDRLVPIGNGQQSFIVEIGDNCHWYWWWVEIWWILHIYINIYISFISECRFSYTMVGDDARNLAQEWSHLPLNKMAAILADDILKCIFLNENGGILIQISLKFVPRSLIDNKAALV